MSSQALLTSPCESRETNSRRASPISRSSFVCRRTWRRTRHSTLSLPATQTYRSAPHFHHVFIKYSCMWACQDTNKGFNAKLVCCGLSACVYLTMLVRSGRFDVCHHRPRSRIRFLRDHKFRASLYQASAEPRNSYQLHGETKRDCQLHGETLRNCQLHGETKRDCQLHGETLRNCQLHGETKRDCQLHGETRRDCQLHSETSSNTVRP